MKHESEFYIGWQPNAPASFGHRSLLSVVALCLIVPIIGALLVLYQRGFASSTFELGTTASIEGVLHTKPAPFVSVYRGADIGGNPIYQHILLVAPGKHGALPTISNFARDIGHDPEGHMVSVQGFLIYHDGKTLMEVEEENDIKDQGLSSQIPQSFMIQGAATLVGEVTDPKCLFGVMKPGHGKPHRSCAARCIAGGIPPVLKTMSANGQTSYYILAGEQGEPLNSEIIPFVGDQISISGQIRRMGEWAVLYKDPTKQINRIPGAVGQDLVMCH